MLIKIYPENPAEKYILNVVETLRKGGVIIYPTDTVYSFACDMKSVKATERLARIKGIKPEKAEFSLICYDLSTLSEYSKNIDNNVFKLMRKNLPGAFTFILEASSKVPKIFKRKKRTVGIRIPDNNIAREIVKQLGNPILSSSLHDDDEIVEYPSDPELIYEKYHKLVDIVIDGGYGKNIASTIVDCTGREPEIVRQGENTPEY